MEWQIVKDERGFVLYRNGEYWDVFRLRREAIEYLDTFYPDR